MLAGYINIMSSQSGKYYLVLAAFMIVIFAAAMGFLSEAIFSNNTHYFILINLVEAV